MIKGRDILAFAVLMMLPALGVAQDDFAHGRIRYLEQGVTLQRGTESGAEEAATNLPFLPGDRIWTDGAGRAEFQFADGSVVRLDSRSKFEYVAHDEGSDEKIVLRLWSGSLQLSTRDGRDVPDFDVETPGGLVETRGHGVFRVDVADGEARLSVHDGRASLDSGRQPVEVEAGERSYARGGEPPESPRRFDATESDDFAQWNATRDRPDAWAGDTRRYLPEEVAPYASELASHGSWYYEAEVGHVWRPYVAPDWRPYTYGRWTWTLYGWTWVPYDSWGWAPFHYGRWGFSGALGWYWIPGRVWSPAWVSWAVGGDYVGWCPLGAGDRPVVGLGNQVRGYAVPRGGTNDSGWTYARRTDIESRDLARRRVNVTPAEVRDLRIADSPKARPSRDFRRVADVEATAPRSVPRNINIKPTVGDFVPELHDDPSTTIPVFSRRMPRERYETRSQPSMSGPQSNATDRRGAGEATAAPRTSTRRHPTDVRYPSTRSAPPMRTPARDQAAPDRADRAQPPRERAVQPTDRQRSEPSTDRDVLRNMFRPLSEPPRGSDVERGTAPRNSPAPPRAEPRQRTPAPPPRAEPRQRTPPPSARATSRPQKDQHPRRR